MNFNEQDYINRKCIIFPNDTTKKVGYIRKIDDLGYTYEVTECKDKGEIGMHFINHSHTFVIKFLDK